MQPASMAGLFFEACNKNHISCSYALHANDLKKGVSLTFSKPSRPTVVSIFCLNHTKDLDLILSHIIVNYFLTEDHTDKVFVIAAECKELPASFMPPTEIPLFFIPCVSHETLNAPLPTWISTEAGNLLELPLTRDGSQIAGTDWISKLCPEIVPDVPKTPTPSPALRPRKPKVDSCARSLPLSAHKRKMPSTGKAKPDAPQDVASIQEDCFPTTKKTPLSLSVAEAFGTADLFSPSRVSCDLMAHAHTAANPTPSNSMASPSLTITNLPAFSHKKPHEVSKDKILSFPSSEIAVPFPEEDEEK